MGRPKKEPNPEHIAYLLKGIDRTLWLKARAKALEERISMKQVLELLLKAWVGAGA